MTRFSALAVLLVLLAATTAMGQTILEPIVTYDVPAVSAWRPAGVPTAVTPAGTTTVTYSTPYTTRYYSEPVVTHYYSEPVVTSYAPIDVAPTTTYYSAPVRTYYSPSITTYSEPVTTYYSPGVTTYYSPAVTTYAPGYVVGRGSIGQPKIYVPGQPVRNTLRFFAP